MDCTQCGTELVGDEKETGWCTPCAREEQDAEEGGDR